MSSVEEIAIKAQKELGEKIKQNFNCPACNKKPELKDEYIDEIRFWCNNCDMHITFELV